MKSHIALLFLFALGLTWAGEVEKEDFKNTNVGDTLKLVCENDKDDDKDNDDATDEEDGSEKDVPVSWLAKVNGSTTFEVIQVEEGRITIDAEKKELVITNVQKSDMGKYRCKMGEDKIIKAWEVTDLTFRLKQMKKSYSRSIGENTDQEDLTCKIKGDAKVVFTWYERPEGEDDKTKNIKICKNDVCDVARYSVVLSNNGQGSTLLLDKVNTTDRKIYTCRVVKKEMESDDIKSEDCTKAVPCFESESLLRVKDPLAAVWPFIGIVIEVVLLCIIIFFCERRRDSKEAEEMDEDEGYNGNNANTSNSNIRQRK